MPQLNKIVLNKIHDIIIMKYTHMHALTHKQSLQSKTPAAMRNYFLLLPSEPTLHWMPVHQSGT